MTLRQALADAARSLARVSATPRLDAELMKAHALGETREEMLLAAQERPVPHGFAGLVDGLVGRIAAELVTQFGVTPVAVATGGLHPLVAGSCSSIGVREPDLTVHGLRLAFERDQASGGGTASRRP